MSKSTFTFSMNKSIYTFDFDSFYNKFGEMYETIYEARDQVDGFCWAVKEFDEVILKKHKDFVMTFVKLRGDAITSDREAAAFTFTLLWFVLGNE